MGIFGEKYFVCDKNNLHLPQEVINSILLTDACGWKSLYFKGVRRSVG